MLVLDGDCAKRLRDRDRKLAAGQEAGGLTREGRQGRLGKDRDETVGLSKIQRTREVEAEQLASRTQAALYALRTGLAALEDPPPAAPKGIA